MGVFAVDKEVNGTNVMMKVPLEAFVVEVAEKAGRAAAHAVIAEHKSTCEALKAIPVIESNRKKIDAFQLKFTFLLGIMIGSGLVGGGLGAGLTLLAKAVL